jgi:hypothetical protein
MQTTLEVADGDLARRQRRRFLFVALLIGHILIGVVMLTDPTLQAGVYAKYSDAARYHRIAEQPGVPYRDFPVEYPPVLVGLVEGISGRSFPPFFHLLVVLQIAADVGCALLIRRRWGERAGLGYLVLSFPMIPVVITRLDLLPTFAAVAAVFLIAGKKERAGGAVLAIATLTKLWAAVLGPLLFVRMRWRAVTSAVVVGGAGLAAWVAMSGGIAGPRDVVTFRGAKGWQVESLPANFLLLFDHSARFHESGAWRVGRPPGWIAPLLVLAVAAVVAFTVWITRVVVTKVDAGYDEFGTPAVVVIAALMIGSTLFSPQFVVWLVPFAAIAGARGDTRTERIALATVLSTILAMTLFNARTNDGVLQQAFFWARNLTVVGLVVFGLKDLVRRARPALAPAEPGLDRSLKIPRRVVDTQDGRDWAPAN